MKYGPPECISALQSAITTIDAILSLPEPIPTGLKNLFGLGDLKNHADFADVLAVPLGTSDLWNRDCIRADGMEGIGKQRIGILQVSIARGTKSSGRS